MHDYIRITHKIVYKFEKASKGQPYKSGLFQHTPQMPSRFPTNWICQSQGMLKFSGFFIMIMDIKRPKVLHFWLYHVQYMIQRF